MKKLMALFVVVSFVVTSCSSHKHCDAYGKTGSKKDKSIKAVSI